MSRTLRYILNEANPNRLGNALQLARFGDFLARAPRTIRATVSSNKIVLPDNAKCERVLACFVTAGTVSGWFEPIHDSTPATTRVSPNAQGDIVFLSTDAVTEAEVTYLPYEGEVVEETVVCSASLALASGGRRVQLVLEAEALAGSVTGVKTINDRAASPATTTANANLLGTGVQFNNGTDAVTRARIKYIAMPGVGSAKGALGANLDSSTFAPSTL